MENSINKNNKKEKDTKKEPDTLKKSEVVTNDDTDKLAEDNLVACASYEPPSDDEFEHEEATLNGYVSTDSELTESLKQLCTQDIARPGRTVLQDMAEEA